MRARRNCAEEAPTRRWQVNYDSRQHPFLLRRVLVQDSVDGRSAHPGPLGRRSLKPLNLKPLTFKPSNLKFTRAASAASHPPYGAGAAALVHHGIGYSQECSIGAQAPKIIINPW